MIKNYASLMVIFAMLAFCSLKPCARSRAHYRFHDRSGQSQYAGRQDYPHHSRNEFQ
jgi:hypothetical protein